MTLSNFTPNAGVIRAGGGGTVAINGALETTAGMMSFDIGGTGTSGIGRVMITGVATLGRTLNLAVVNGFSPAIGNTVPVLTYGSRTGPFTTINGLTIGNGNQFTPTYNATNLTLNVTAAPTLPGYFYRIILLP